MEDYCGNCKFFTNEDIYGHGWCKKLDCGVACGDKACKLFEERYD